MPTFSFQLPDGAEFEVDAETVEGASQILDGMLGRQSPEPTAAGAPMRVRAAVGSARTPASRLATLRGFYPDARPYGDDNFTFTDETGQTRLYNPRGLDLGDIPAVGGEIAEAVGGTLGAIGGAVVGAPAGPVGVLGGTMAGAGLGGTVGLNLYDSAMRHLGGTVETRSMPKIVADQTNSFLMNAAGEGVGRYLGEAVPQAARHLLSKPGVDERMDLFARTGVDATGAPAEIAGGRFTGILTSGVERMPGGQRLANARERTMQSFENRVDDVARTMAGGTVPPRGATGEIIREGAEIAGREFNQTRQAMERDLYARTANVSLGRDDFAAMRNLQQEVNLKLARNPGTSQHLKAASQELDAILDQASRGRTSYADLDEYRRTLGQRLEEPSVSTAYVGEAGKGLRRVYGALRRDLDRAVSRQAPDAVPYVQAHDDFVKTYKSQRGESGKTPMEIMDSIGRRDTDQLVGWSKQGLKTGAGRISQLRDILPDAQFDQFRAAFVRDMGLNPKTGEFSPTRFRGSFFELSPKAREVLFGQEYAQIDDLASVGRLVGKVEEMVNRSNTAPTAMVQGLIAGGAGTGSVGGLLTGHVWPVVGTALGIGSTMATARGLTSKGYAPWLAGTAQTPPWLQMGQGLLGRTGVQFAPGVINNDDRIR